MAGPGTISCLGGFQEFGQQDRILLQFSLAYQTMMGSKEVRKGAWTGEEDNLLRKCIEIYGEGKWHQVPPRAGLNRCRKSCRLRWLNYLKPNINRGEFTEDEVDLMVRLHKLLGNRQVLRKFSTSRIFRKWSLIAARLPGRTSNDVKNYWNTHVHKKLVSKSKEMNLAESSSVQIVKTKVIKPRPRTFCKPWLRKNVTVPENVQVHRQDDVIVSNYKPPPTVDQAPENEISIEWWESLLDDKEFNNEGCTCPTDRMKGETITSLCVEDIVAAATETDHHNASHQVLGENQWSDLSFDSDLWSIFNAI